MAQSQVLKMLCSNPLEENKKDWPGVNDDQNIIEVYLMVLYRYWEDQVKITSITRNYMCS